MNEKFNKNAKVEKLTNKVGRGVRLIAIGPLLKLTRTHNLLKLSCAHKVVNFSHKHRVVNCAQEPKGNTQFCINHGVCMEISNSVLAVHDK